MNFIIRIELIGHGHDSDAYQALHETMRGKNVLRTITAADGLVYNLPSATYSYAGNFTNVAVRDWIKAIVEGLGYQHWILVTGGESAWLLDAV